MFMHVLFSLHKSGIDIFEMTYKNSLKEKLGTRRKRERERESEIQMLHIGYKWWRHICLIKHHPAAINTPSEKDTLLPLCLLEKPDSESLI